MVQKLQPTSSTGRAQLMVNDSASILKRFYFLQRELVLVQAGWLPGTEHWQSKLLLPEFLWQDSLTCQELRQRILELRYPLRAIDLPPDEALVRLWRSFADAPSAFAFAEGLGRVLKPLLRQAYRDYLERADDLDDGPTLRILTHALTDLDEQIDRWGDAAEERRASYPEAQPQVDRWLEGLRQWQAALGDLLAPEPRIGAAPIISRHFDTAISRPDARPASFWWRWTATLFRPPRLAS